SSSKISQSMRFAPRPPNSRGQVIMPQFPLASVRSHWRCWTNPASLSRVLSGTFGTCTCIHSRTSARKRCCSGVNCRFRATAASVLRGLAVFHKRVTGFLRVLVQIHLEREALFEAVAVINVARLDAVEGLLGQHQCPAALLGDQRGEG